MSAFERLHPAVRYHVVNSLGWSSLRPTQLDAIGPIQRGDHALLLAPTAGGKTEAAIIPVLSRMSIEGWGGLSVLYVCPIKALLNNLEPRLSRYAGLLGRKVEIWHGDIAATRKKRALADPPDIVLTTPESIEGMLISRSVDQAAWLGGVRAVIVDELHAIASDDRGWHLRSVLSRLSNYCRTPPQRIGLSATVSNPQALLDWLAPTGARQVIGASSVSTDASVTVDHVSTIENAALVISRLHAGEKRLVFCDSRAAAERLGAGLREQGIRTFVSHASLSAAERRQSEAAFGEERDCVIVATSTLELGIDVGDLDRVIQLDAPRTVSSFLQRMGRTGRRAGAQRNCLFLTTKPLGLLTAAGICRLWSEQYVEPVSPPELPWHVVAQQGLLAVVEARQGLLWEDCVRTLAAAFPELSATGIGTLLDHLCRTGWLAGGRALPLTPGPLLEKTYGRSHYRDLMATFSGGDLLVARHGITDVGLLDPSLFSGQEEGLPKVLLAGHVWQVTSVDWKKRIAHLLPAEGGGKAQWMGTGPGMSAALADAIRRVLMDGQLGAATLSRRAAAALDELSNEIPAGDQPQTQELAAGRFRLWTFAGSRENRRLALAESAIGAEKSDALAIDYRTDPRQRPEGRGESVGALRLPSTEVQRLSRVIKFHEVLPDDQLEALVTARY